MGKNDNRSCSCPGVDPDGLSSTCLSLSLTQQFNKCSFTPYCYEQTVLLLPLLSKDADKVWAANGFVLSCSWTQAHHVPALMKPDPQILKTMAWAGKPPVQPNQPFPGQVRDSSVHVGCV